MMRLFPETEFKLLKLARELSYGLPSTDDVAGEAQVLLKIQEIFRDCLLSDPFPLSEIEIRDIAGPIDYFKRQEETKRLKILKVSCELGRRLSTRDSTSVSIAQETQNAYRVLSVRFLENGSLGIGRINHVPGNFEESLVPGAPSVNSTLPEEAGHLNNGADTVQLGVCHKETPSSDDVPSSDSSSDGHDESVAPGAEQTQKGAA